VLDAAVFAGLSLAQVLARVETGVWPGLASFYARYRRPGTRRTALLADWRKAVGYVTAQRARTPTRTLCVTPHQRATITRGAPGIADHDQQLSGPGGRPRSTGGCGPGGPRWACWSTPGTPAARVSPPAGCCGPG